MMLRRRAVVALTVLALGAAGCGSTVQQQSAGSAGQLLGGGDGLGDPLGTGTDGVEPDSTGPVDAAAGGPGTASGHGAPAEVPLPGAPSTGGEPEDGSTSDSGQPASSGGAAAQIAATGPGWDSKRAFIGVPYQESSSSSAAADAFGLSLVGIDYKAVADAVIADINKRGGLFGRTLTPVYAEFPPVQSTGQAQCEQWTRDTRVFAVTESFLPEDTMSACLARARVPFANGSLNAIDQRVMDRYKPYYRKMGTASNTTLFPTWISRLKAQGYFTGWDTRAGRSGSAPVTVGLLCREDTEATRNGCSDLQRLLKAQGLAVAEPFRFSGMSTPGNDAVLRFVSEKVTHVFSQTTDYLFFMQSAESQGYRPRYAMTSTNAPNLLASSVPKEQLVGALGVGSSPLVDVAQPPPLGPGRDRCQKVLKDARVKVDPSWAAQSAAQGLCDGIYLFAEAALRGGGLAAADVIAGLTRVKETFQPGAIFALGLSGSRFDAAAAVRDLGWDADCRCFRFLSTKNWAS